MTKTLELPKFQEEREPEEHEFMELVYDEAAMPIIFKHFPYGYFENASDEIHPGRFGIILPKTDRDKFYTLMILEGYIRSCLCFELQLRTGQAREDLTRWIKSVKKLRKAGYTPH